MKKVALIGNGHIAKATYLKYFRENTCNYHICAVVNPNIKSAQNFSENYDIPKAYDDIEKMIKNESPDLVIVCSPNNSHYEYVIKSLNNGIHVFCEKPPAMNAIEAKTMYETAKTKNLMLGYNFPHRFSSESKFLKRNIYKLGQVYYVEANAIRKNGIPTWGTFTDKNIQGGGPLIDIGIHILDAALNILDYPKVKSVYANQFRMLSEIKIEKFLQSTKNNDYSIEDSLFGILELENGSIIKINTSYLLNIEENNFNIKMAGTDSGANLYPLKIFSNTDDNNIIYEEEKEEIEPLNRFGCLEEFCKKIESNEKTNQEAFEGFIIQYIIESLYISAETGKKVYLNY